MGSYADCMIIVHINLPELIWLQFDTLLKPELQSSDVSLKEYGFYRVYGRN